MQVETLILGAGAAGMMAAAHAGPDTLVIDHARAPGEKIRISGGGRCNFTNIHTAPDNFLSQNPHFCKSALARYSQWDFIDRIDRAGIAWHEKSLGQLFCDGKATQVVAMLVDDLRAAGAELWLQTGLSDIAHRDGRFHATLDRDGQRRKVTSRNLVLATGGKSIPKMGATGLAYDLAARFGHAVTETRPALVPLTFGDRFAALSGVSLPVRIRSGEGQFEEAMLFTHRGLSGPAILQISSYWTERQTISVDLSPGADLFDMLRSMRAQAGRRKLSSALGDILPAKLAEMLAGGMPGNLADLSDTRLRGLTEEWHDWTLTPSGSEGYRTAEVTLGGIDTDGINSRTMMSKTLPGLYMIGEAVDVTGWLGGFNFQWAWASGAAAGRAIQQAR